MAFWRKKDHATDMQRTQKRAHQQPLSRNRDAEIASLNSRLDSTQRALERIEAELSRTIHGYQNQVRRLEDEVHSLKLTVKERDQSIQSLKMLNTYLTIQLFGSDSEKNATAGKSNTADASNSDPDSNGKKKRKRGQQPGSPGHGRTQKEIVNQSVEPVELKVKCCEVCGREFKILDMTKESRLIEYLQEVKETIYQRQMASKQCECPGSKLKIADLPRKLFKGSDIGNSLWVHFLTMKYLHGMPTNRILKALTLQGVRFPAGTVTRGLKELNKHFVELYEAMKKHCQGGELWNADETSWRVMDVDKMKHWLWVVASQSAVVYLLDKSRSSKVPKGFFQHSSGVLVTDRYSAYKALGKLIRKAWCWVHVRRDFLAIFKGIKKHKHWAKKWLKRIADLFAWNHKKFKLIEEGLKDSEEWKAADKKLRQLIERFDAEVRSELSLNELDKEQHKVIRSLRRHWTGLTLFVDEPHIPMHNNRAERLLRNPVLIRKGSYGSGTGWSGEQAAMMFTFFQTWQMNGLNPEALLRDLLDEKSGTGAGFVLDNYLPWKMSADRKKQFALPTCVKRPA